MQMRDIDSDQIPDLVIERVVFNIAPDNATHVANVGVALRDLDRFDEAADMFRQACALDPTNGQNHYRLGLSLLKGLRPAEATPALKRAIELDPSQTNAALSLALSQLASGDYENGWKSYEVRFDHEHSIADPFPEQRWHGEPIEGTLVVGSEQGLGDMI